MGSEGLRWYTRREDILNRIANKADVRKLLLEVIDELSRQLPADVSFDFQHSPSLVHPPIHPTLEKYRATDEERKIMEQAGPLPTVLLRFSVKTQEQLTFVTNIVTELCEARGLHAEQVGSRYYGIRDIEFKLSFARRENRHRTVR